MVIYVVKNASRPVSGELLPGPDGKRFAFQTVCIVTLSRRLCKLFLRWWQLNGCGAIDKEIPARLCYLKIKFAVQKCYFGLKLVSLQ